MPGEEHLEGGKQGDDVAGEPPGQKFPTGHTTEELEAVPEGQPNPGGETQGCGITVAPPQKNPFEHNAQLSREVPPVVALKVPGGQGVGLRAF